ncbi:MAG: RagB/SusD family nutrient uptake outer membrane protein [Dyadobacter sp. 50-39]|uniref:RagB/SusD family nutrient uptake outer membrane protein n=1 Tax=Dyadobacter sp. 50-39 TaxID=1895756 RepID=UPI0009634CC7|nr:RagB/SusD family nutrient uptake outer membrane protein [Dyadobacter sp. 50-39]OJV17212.1 MAG: RagB/SusD family nutrient uptake outer membrane protein [Dyadobacter sp. 50-39]
MKKIIYFLMGLAAVFQLAGCDESKLDLESQSAYDYKTYFTSSEGLNQAVIATYATLLHNGLWSREYYFIFDLLGYEAKKTTNLQGDMAQLADYSFGTSQAQIGQLWNSLYRLILRSNVVIDRAGVWNPASAADQQAAKQYIAEARFLRSYAYFNIVNLWGKAPLITAYDSTVANNYPSRASAEAIWATIENDLKLAAADLPVTYDAATGLGRATKGAAVALLGKSYLYQKKWARAETTLAQLTAAPFTYSLDPSYENLFSSTNQSSPENIFQIMNAKWTDWGIGNQYYVFGGQETWGGKATHSDRAQEYGFKDWFNVYIPTTTVKSFQYANPATGANYIDPRAKFTFYGSKESGGDTQYCQKCAGGPIDFPFKADDPQGYYVWKKYQYYNEVASYGGPQSSINGQVIRFADVLLMLAEAQIQQGKTGSDPLALINQVRKRSGAVAYTTLGAQADALKILMRERQVELCGEQSRYFDLIRWGIAKQTLNAQRAAEPGDGKQPFQDKNVLLPIPDVEKNYNPNVAKDIANGWN